MTTAEQLIDNDLQELLGGIAAPDLIDQTLARIDAGEGGAIEARSAGENTDEQGAPVGKLIEGRFIMMRRLATAACVLIALGLISWVLWPKPLPETVSSTTNASYLVRDDHIQLKAGWLLLSDGAPEVRVDVGRVSHVQGRAVVGAGIPDEAALDSLADELHLSATEREMLSLQKRWLTAGGLALCLLTGQAMLNDKQVSAADLPGSDALIKELPALNDADGIRDLLRLTHYVEVCIQNPDAKNLSNQQSCWGEVTSRRDVVALVEAMTGPSFRPVNDADTTVDRVPGWKDWSVEVWFVLPGGKRIAAYDFGGTGKRWAFHYPGSGDVEVYWHDGAFGGRLLPVLEDIQRKRVPSAHWGWDAIRVLNGSRILFGGTEVELDGAESTEFLHAFLPQDNQPSREAQIGKSGSFLVAFVPSGKERRVAEAVPATLADPFATLFVPGGRVALLASPDFKAGTVLLRYDGWSHYYKYRLVPDARAQLEDRIGKHRVAELVNEQVEKSTVAPFKVLREWTGADSQITEGRCDVIGDTASWAKLWIDHKGMGGIPPKAPDVDFDKEMVVAVFRGSGWNSRGYYVVEMLESGSAVTVRVDENRYQTANGADKVTPYGIFVLPKSDLSIAVEEQVQSLKNQPPIWKSIGGRVQPDRVATPGTLWQPTYTRVGGGGPGRQEFRVIYNHDQWNEAVKEIGVTDEQIPMPDFGKSIGFVALATRLKGLDDLKLTPAGWNDRKSVVRLEIPVAQSEGNSEYERIYGLWLFPRPNRDVVLEEPILSMTEPTRWRETETFFRRTEPFGVYDVRSRLEGGTKDASFKLARTAAEFNEYSKDIAGIANVIPPEWVDWKTESVIVAFIGEKRIEGGLNTTTLTLKGEHYITYHLLAPSGRDPGLKRPYMLIKIPATNSLIVLDQSLVSGPAPATVKEVARFGKR